VDKSNLWSHFRKIGMPEYLILAIESLYASIYLSSENVFD